MFQLLSSVLMNAPILRKQAPSENIERVELEFKESKWAVPFEIEVRLSTVANDYAFEEMSELETYSFSKNDFQDYDEQRIKSLDIASANGYGDGYQQFLHLKFTEIRREDKGLIIEKVRCFGTRTKQEFTRAAAVDLNVTSDAVQTSLGKVNIVETSVGFESHDVTDAVFMDNAEYWMSGSGDDAYFVFDLNGKENEVKSIQIKLYDVYSCEMADIYTTNTFPTESSSDWKLVGSLNDMEVQFGFQCFARNPTVDFGCFVLIRFARFSHYYVGIEQIKFIAKGLDEDLHAISLEDVMQSDPVMDEIAAQYLKKLDLKLADRISWKYSEIAVLEKRDGILSKQWIEAIKEALLLPFEFVHNRQMATAKRARTVDEERNGIAAAEEQWKRAKALIEGTALKEKVSENRALAEKVKEKVAKQTAYFEAVSAGKVAEALEQREEYTSILRDVWLEFQSGGAYQEVTGFKNDEGRVDPMASQAIQAMLTQIDRQNGEFLRKQNEPIFKVWSDSVDQNPSKLVNLYSVHQYIAAVRWAIQYQPDAVKKWIERLAVILDEAMAKNDGGGMHKFHLFLLSEVYDVARPNGTAKMSKKISDRICEALNGLGRDKAIDAHTKHFCKFLCCWSNALHYNDMLKTGKQTMNILKQPLIAEYEALQKRSAGIIGLKLEDHHKSKGVRTNFELLEAECKSWGYEPRKAFYPKDLAPIIKRFKELNFKFDADFKDIARNNVLDEKNPIVVSADDMAMTLLNCVAAKVDSSFQKSMNEVFDENRKKLKLPLGDAIKDNDIGVHSGPLKTKSRQNVKIRLKYFKHPPPQCMAVTDIVRCGIVCESDEELCSLFHLICERFSGKMLRVKNAFDTPEKGNDSWGYRAVLMNIIYGDEKELPYPEFQMVCEVQLILLSYFKVRKPMHLGYGIVRSEFASTADDKKPYYVLAQDSCKFGKFDSKPI